MNNTPIDSNFYAVIPAGGVGSRLWPLSRVDSPKFLLDFTGSGRSLLRETFDRVARLVPTERIIVVTGDHHAEAVVHQLPKLTEGNLIAEPSPRESTAAIALAAAILVNQNPDAIIGSFAADVANLSRIVTLHDVAIAQVAAKDAREGATGNLIMEATARTYRYLDANEVADQQKKAAAAKAAAAVKK